MTNRAASFPATPSIPLRRGFGGKLASTAELAIHALGDSYFVEGTGSVQALPPCPEGPPILLHFVGTPTFVNSPQLLMPAGQNYTFSIGDSAWVLPLGDGIWRVIEIMPAAGIVNTTTAQGQGRLTLTAGVPILSSDVTAATSIYYSPLVGQYVPVFDGSAVLMRRFTASDTDSTGQVLALDSNAGHTGYHQAGNPFDLFFAWVSGTLYFGTGPSWASGAVGGSSTARGTGAGSTELQWFRGMWTNKNSMTLRFGTNSGDTVTVPINQAKAVGTAYMTTDGVTQMTLNPAPAAGGTNNVLALDNFENLVPMMATMRPSDNNWTYATATWRAANASNSNRITFVKGLAVGRIDARYSSIFSNAASAGGSIGIGFDSTSAIASGCLTGFSGNSSSITQLANWRFDLSGIGLHYIQALEKGNGNTTTFNGNAGDATTFQSGLSAEIFM